MNYCATGAITALGVATNGQIPIGDGATDPILATITGTASEITVTNGAGTITLDLPDPIVTNLTGNASGTASSLASNPSDCAADTWADAIAANGDLTCTVLNGGAGMADGTIVQADLAAASVGTGELRLDTGSCNSSTCNSAFTVNRYAFASPAMSSRL